MQGDLAQLGERHPYKVDVTGSSPVVSTISLGRLAKWPNAADCKSVPSGSVVQIRHLPPLVWGIAKR